MIAVDYAIPVTYDYTEEALSAAQCAYLYEQEDLVVAVVFPPLFGRSARFRAMREVAKRYASLAPTVYVTCDLDLYRLVQGGLTGDLRATILARRNGVVYTATQ